MDLDTLLNYRNVGILLPLCKIINFMMLQFLISRTAEITTSNNFVDVFQNWC